MTSKCIFNIYSCMNLSNLTYFDIFLYYHIWAISIFSLYILQTIAFKSLTPKYSYRDESHINRRLYIVIFKSKYTQCTSLDYPSYTYMWLPLSLVNYIQSNRKHKLSRERSLSISLPLLCHWEKKSEFSPFEGSF